MQKEVDNEVNKLLADGVIEPVSTPPTWVSPLVVVPTYQIPTPEESLD